MIAPTVGRVILYRPQLGEMSFTHDQPFRADVCHINDDGTVNLSVNSESGRQFIVNRVLICQTGEPARGEAFWMDYQRQQAEKALAQEVKGTDLKATAALTTPNDAMRLTEEEVERKVRENKFPSVTADRIESVIVTERYFVDGTLTLCVLTLRNGFKVVGESACVDPRNFKEDVGRAYARSAAFEKIWQLEGYALAERVIGTLLAR